MGENSALLKAIRFLEGTFDTVRRWALYARGCCICQSAPEGRDTLNLLFSGLCRGLISEWNTSKARARRQTSFDTLRTIHVVLIRSISDSRDRKPHHGRVGRDGFLTTRARINALTSSDVLLGAKGVSPGVDGRRTRGSSAPDPRKLA